MCNFLVLLHFKILHLVFSLHPNKHVTNICRDSNFHIRALRHIRPMLDEATANKLACSIVNARLDYCNSILYHTSNNNINQLQRTQNSLARVVCSVPRRTSAAPLLKRLHWLPVEKRIEYKIASITHQVMTAESPSYLNELLTQHKPTRCLRSSDKFLLDVPQTRTRSAERAFRTAAPSVWNNLPEELRAIRCHDAFKRNLKTVLFEAAHSVS